MSTEVQVISDALPAPAIRAQVALIQDVMKSVMIADTHYGVIPGTGTKPSLLKPGAEKLCLTFRLDPQYESTEHFMGEHLFVRSTCVLYHQTTGRRMGSGQGSCSTRESKYAYRQGKRVCPLCGKESIIKGKEQYGGGWLCWKKKEGCGAQWPDGAKEIEGQNVERVANEDIADQYNTVLKMANKRSLIAAVLNVTAASDIFTQDIEDLQETHKELKPGEIKLHEDGTATQRTMNPAPSKATEPLDSVEQHTHGQGDGASAGAREGTSKSYTQQASDAPAPSRGALDVRDDNSNQASVAWLELIGLSETITEASKTGTRIEQDDTLDLFAKTTLREAVKQKVLSLRAKKS